MVIHKNPYGMLFLSLRFINDSFPKEMAVDGYLLLSFCCLAKTTKWFGKIQNTNSLQEADFDWSLV